LVMNSLPMMATGKIIKDYRPLIKYLELADRELRSRTIPNSSDIEVIKELLARGTSNLSDLINELTKYIRNRVDPELARKAVREVLGTDVDSRTAEYMISRIIAGWVIEMAEQFGIVKLKSRYLKL